MHPSSWKPRHVITIVALISGAIVLAPAAVHAVTSQPVTIFDQSGEDPASVDGNGALKVSDTGPQFGEHYWTAELTSQNPTATLGGVNCLNDPGFCPWPIYSVGVTSPPSAKSPSYVQFKVVRYDATPEMDTCVIPPVGTHVDYRDWNLPSLWAPPKGQADYQFAVPQTWGGPSDFVCVVAYLISGGPVDVHSESPSESV